MLDSLQGIQDWFLEYGALGLALMAFIESFIFPVPPDPLLISLSLVNTNEALFYGGLTTVASVLGGLFGYFIGVQAGRPLLLKLFKKDQVKRVTELFAAYGGWAVFLAAFTPIPYKVFTIAAGISKINLISFLAASIVGRGLRFGLIGAIIYFLGPKAKEIINNYFEIFTVAFSLLLVVGFLIYKFRPKKTN